MDYIKNRQEHSAYLQLLMLAVFALIGIFAGTVLAVIICLCLYGTNVFSASSGLLSGDPKFLAGLKIFQIFSTAGLFLAPPVFLAFYQGKKVNGFYGFKKPRVNLLLVVLLLMIISMPLMEWVAVLNQKMTFPEFLKPIGDWMREKEDEAARMTVLLLSIHNVRDFIVDLFMIALLPAMAEELMFRGAIQRSFSRVFNSPHAAIWITAVIFSAIHMQFFGFFPRLFLGAAFGYLYVWSGSLWYGMLAHFLNNAYAVCMAWYMQKHHIPFNSTEPTVNVHWYGYVISLVLSILLLQYFKYKTTKSDEKQLG